MAPQISLPILASANVLVAVALLIFATGFFPYKPFIPGHAAFEEHHHGAQSVPAYFDKVILMVVDALRSDFVYSKESHFSFVQSLIRSGTALPFTAHASSPTITMPRVKAITTGSIPSFLDVILNFAESDTSSSLANQDTWLSQLKQKDGGKLVMYGDDTWLKLFPETFARANGTSSFFVSDFTEVDNNVTRHIPYELERSDWNGMIMHYLGLDHIGHKSGPKSLHMKPKQAEMDQIVRQIFNAIESKKHLSSTLLVLCGDHGMNDGGNHGGAAEGETSPALVFMSPRFRSISEGLPCPADMPLSGDFGYYTKIEQSDIAPTLAGLLGFPVPLNNLGVFVPQVLNLWTRDQQFRLMYQNARQILDIVKGTFPHIPFDGDKGGSDCKAANSKGDMLSCLWSRAVQPSDSASHQDQHSLENYRTFSQEAQKVLSSTASNYDLSRLSIGTIVATISVLLAVEASHASFMQAKATGLWFFVATLAYGGLMFASSYVEEEQHFWYWLGSAWLGWLFLKQDAVTRVSLQAPADNLRRRESVSSRLLNIGLSFTSLSTLRVVRSWNQTGQKHAGSPDIAKHILPNHTYVLWTLIVLTYMDAAIRLSRHALPWASRALAVAASAVLGVASFSFKIAFTRADAPELLTGLESLPYFLAWEASLIIQARAVFLFAFAVAFATLIPGIFPSSLTSSRISRRGSISAMHHLLTIILFTQSRTANVPLFLLFRILTVAFEVTDLSTIDITFTCLIFQHIAFFAFGGSNAISSVDLSNAYNGVSGYNVVAVGFLTFLSNWAGPIWWTSAMHLLLSRQQTSGGWAILKQNIAAFTAFATGSVLAVMLACAALRTHLFIWTVFSPKYLYTLAWVFGQHICVNIGYGSFLYWLENGDALGAQMSEA